jgi:rhodanese-related sulfurtransferase
MVGAGFYGTSSYEAVTHVLRAGYKNVGWLIGGEEALAAANYPSIDRRIP